MRLRLRMGGMGGSGVMGSMMHLGVLEGCYYINFYYVYLDA